MEIYGIYQSFVLIFATAYGVSNIGGRNLFTALAIGGGVQANAPVGFPGDVRCVRQKNEALGPLRHACPDYSDAGLCGGDRRGDFAVYQI